MSKIVLDGRREYTLEAPDGAYSVRAKISDDGRMDLIDVVFDSDEPAVPPVISITWEVPSVDIQGVWHPVCHTSRGIPCVWEGGWTSSAAKSAPMCCLFSSGGENRLMYACSDAMNPVNYRFVLREEDSKWLCSTKLFDAPTATCSHYV